MILNVKIINTKTVLFVLQAKAEKNISMKPCSRLSKIACLCSNKNTFSETLKVANTFILWMVLPFNTFQQLKDASWNKFVWCFSTTHHERANKIDVHGYPFCPVRNY